jgi:hypothetical protein
MVIWGTTDMLGDLGRHGMAWLFVSVLAKTPPLYRLLIVPSHLISSMHSFL